MYICIYTYAQLHTYIVQKTYHKLSITTLFLCVYIYIYKYMYIYIYTYTRLYISIRFCVRVCELAAYHLDSFTDCLCPGLEICFARVARGDIEILWEFTSNTDKCQPISEVFHGLVSFCQAGISARHRMESMVLQSVGPVAELRTGHVAY